MQHTLAPQSVLKDPVCGMTVTAQSAHAYSHSGRSYYFCSAGCKTKFAADPLKYLAPPAASPPAPVAGRRSSASSSLGRASAVLESRPRRLSSVGRAPAL